MNPVFLSIVSPVYMGEKMVAPLVARIGKSMKAITEDYEIILVNDSSPDDSWTEITRQCATDVRIKGVNLSRNFGQHYAITAGLRFATGQWVVVMDCDLQDRPEEIPNLLKKAHEGWDIVFARREERQDSILKRLSSALFHRVYDWMSGSKTDKTIANFGIYSPSRLEGSSSYNLRKLLKLSFNIMISNTNKPLRLAVEVGFIIAAVAFLLALYNLAAKWSGIIEVQGFTTTVFSIWFVGGLLLAMMGVLGLYIDKIFEQVKGRPLFVVMDLINIDKDKK